MRRTAVFLLLVTLTLSAAPSKKKPAVSLAAPDQVPHTIAQFLRTLSKDGRQSVTFKATAIGTRFFFEEPAGVTVYRYVKGNYVRETFVKGGKLGAVVKRFAKT
ncbi:MAG TPA: hypothetical protein VGQ76_08755 [Thermoanaerobaculia bacterium]|jgi:hypothetical protein|nr:hypothetical protein [Thermoanaerobaculia bacterium]